MALASEFEAIFVSQWLFIHAICAICGFTHSIRLDLIDAISADYFD